MNNTIDFLKTNITRHYQKLTKQEIIDVAVRIQAALEVLEYLGHKKTFKGLDKTFINSHPTLRDGLKAREAFMLAHLPFCLRHCTKFAKGDPQKLEELMQESVISLGRAAELFDPSQGYASTTFVNYWLIQSSLAYLRKTSSSFKISPNIYSLRNKIQKENQNSALLNEPLKSEAELAQLFEVPLKHIKMAMGIFIEVSGDECESNGNGDINVTKFEQIPNPVNELEETLEHYAKVADSFPHEIKDTLGYAIMRDVLATLRTKQLLSDEQLEKVNDYLKTKA